MGLKMGYVEEIEEMICAVEAFYLNDSAQLTSEYMDQEQRHGAYQNWLYDRYLCLDFTRTEPGLGNRDSQLECRIDCWQEAHRSAGSSLTEREWLFGNLFLRFLDRYRSGAYPILTRQPGSGLTDQETIALRKQTLELFSAWVRDYLHLPWLTDRQMYERTLVQNWIDGARRGLCQNYGPKVNGAGFSSGHL